MHAQHPATTYYRYSRLGHKLMTHGTVSGTTEKYHSKRCQTETSVLDTVKTGVLPASHEAHRAAVTFSPQPDTSLHCETTDTGVLHRAVCLFTPQLSLVLFAPIPTGGWPGWVDWYWLNIRHYNLRNRLVTSWSVRIPLLLTVMQCLTILLRSFKKTNFERWWVAKTTLTRESLICIRVADNYSVYRGNCQSLTAIKSRHQLVDEQLQGSVSPDKHSNTTSKHHHHHHHHL